MLILILNFTFLIFQMQYCTSLWMIKRCWSIKRAQNKCNKHSSSYSLQSQSVVSVFFTLTNGYDKVQKINYLHPIESIALLMNADIIEMPSPLPDTMNISTNSRRRLKYWATMSVEQSRVIPTPTPTTPPVLKTFLICKPFFP